MCENIYNIKTKLQRAPVIVLARELHSHTQPLLPFSPGPGIPAGCGLVELTEPFGRLVRLELKPARSCKEKDTRNVETADRLPGLLSSREMLKFNIASVHCYFVSVSNITSIDFSGLWSLRMSQKKIAKKSNIC